MKAISMNNTKLANTIPKYDDLTGTRNILCTSAFGQKRIEIQFVITQNLSRFDMAVADAIYSLKWQGISKFTARKVLVAMSGDENISVPKERRLEIEKVIDKLISTDIHISCPEEENDDVLPRYDGKIVNAVRETNGYRLQGDRPLTLHAYGEDKKQMITVPWELLNYRALEGREKMDNIINSDENILLKYYLIRQLEIVRNKTNKIEEKTFLIKSKKEIFENLGIKKSDFTEESYMNKVRDIYRRMELLFEYWKRIGYIWEYETDKKEYSFSVSQDKLCNNIVKTLKKNKEDPIGS